MNSLGGLSVLTWCGINDGHTIFRLMCCSFCQHMKQLLLTSEIPRTCVKYIYIVIRRRLARVFSPLHTLCLPHFFASALATLKPQAAGYMAPGAMEQVGWLELHCL